ncbi:MAG: D-aminoacyl-tRNA deacylase [Halobacteriaceae archaeon]
MDHIGVVVSHADEASERIGAALREAREWTAHEDASRPPAAGGGTVRRSGAFELRTFADLHLHLEDVAAAFGGPRFVVFASRHSGESGPLLTAHFTGNVGQAPYGGEPGELARACPNAARRVLAALDANAPPDYDVGMECTHHGPSRVGAPSMFVELGSGPEQWADADAAAAVAGAILTLGDVDPTTERTVVGFGGGHYAPRPTRIVRETDWAVGHVAADWALSDRTGDDVLLSAFERSDAEYAVVEGDHPDVRETVAAADYRVVSETWLRESVGVPAPLIERLEAALCPVDEGLRVGARAADADPAAPVATVSLPAALLDEADGVDRDRTRTAVADRTLAYETAEGGTRATPRVVAPGGDDGAAAREAIVDALAAVLREKYDDVERTDGAVVARRAAFDPGAARDRGVPEGPAFGRLAEGETVTVDGETVRPAEVRRSVVRRFET